MNNSTADTTDRRQRAISFMTHLICILMLFFLPEVISQLHHRHRVENSVTVWIYVKSAIYVMVFYVNYYLLINRAVCHNRWIARLSLYNLVVVAITMALFYAIFLFGWQSSRAGFTPNPFPFLVRDLVMVILTIALSVALKMSDNWNRMRQKEQELIAVNRREELEGLKNQLNPHFLFNSLNTIYALIAVSPEKAQTAVHELSRLLRYVLYENPSTVRLADEIDFINNYVGLMRLRLGDRANIAVDIDCQGAEDTQIPPLLFIPPIENMFKHGVTNDPSKPMSILIKCDGRILECTTTNHCVPPRHDQENGGIGLTNLSRRLELTYGHRACLSINRNGDIFALTIKINLDNDKSTLLRR